MTYTPATGAIRDRLRLLIGDRSGVISTEVFSDDELDMVLSEADQGLYTAAALVYLALSASTARSALAWKALGQDIEVDKRTIPAAFRLLADSMIEKAAIYETAGESTVWSDENVVQLVDSLAEAGFYNFQHTNPAEAE